MAGCTNCFSGCVETTSDKCVKYTGSAIEFLGINTGDTLESVEEAITDYLATVLTGEGISPTIDPNEICDLVDSFLPASPTLVDILTALVQTACALEDEIEIERARIDVIEDDYTVDCLSVAADAGTHDVLQAVITELCTAIDDIVILQNLYATCITTATINTYIQDYINALAVDTKMYSKMIPYVAYPYFATDLTPFGMNGVGTGAWEKVYLCNGYGGLTPDLRGRILVSALNVGGGALDVNVDPMASADNPNYVLNMTYGANSVAISEDQMPSHSHSITSDGIHSHTLVVDGANNVDGTGEISGGPYGAEATGSEQTEDSTAHTHTLGTTGNNETHLNVPPVIACYYIMYIP